MSSPENAIDLTYVGDTGFRLLREDSDYRKKELKCELHGGRRKATGSSRLTSTAAFSPGIIISTPSGQLIFAGDVRGPEVELWLVPTEELCVPSPFVAQHALP